MSDTRGGGGRYSRTTNGLIASLVVSVVAVTGIVVFRSIFSDELEVEQEPVAYAAAVESARDAGLDLIAPSSLPDGWVVTSIDLTRGREIGWRLGVLIEEETFVGLFQEDAPVDDLFPTLGIDEPAEESEVSLPGDLAATWTTWSDEADDDVAYTTEIGEETVVVYGSATAADQEAFIALLTADGPLSDPTET